MQYKNFTLDDFQVEALNAVDQQNTVIVCAPTGSGKTLVAEYIIDKCIRENAEVIYTAPIKALSNQKYRDFKSAYGDKVGIITGDVVINPGAPCLIMTTEIFRNIIYDDPKRLTHVKYVIFDEIHFLEDPRRGTVWEESIMLAPSHIRFLCLSATIANVEELAAWMQSIRGHEVSIVLHTVRPVPLDSFVYIEGGNRAFQLNNLNSALSYANSIAARKKQLALSGATHEQMRSGTPIFEFLKAKDLIPTLCFSFSRKNCEKLAFYFKYMNLLTPEESAEASAIYDEHINKFNLQNYLSSQNLRRLIEHGTAFHHAGMLPPQKDIVEVLFSKNLIKLLFATETFAVGINMPARTVVFDGLEKNDGVSFRYLKSHEFHQMSGRAGRRGIDPKGFVYALIDPKYYNYNEVKKTLTGKIEPLKSQFAFSYSSILNLYAERNKEEIIEVCHKSFGYFQMKNVINMKIEKLNELEQKLGSLDCRLPDPRKTLTEYVESINTIDDMKRKYIEFKRQLRKTPPHEHDEIRRRMNKAQMDMNSARKTQRRIKCPHCHNQKNCLLTADGYYSAKQELHELDGFMGFDLDEKFAFLEKIGYVDKEKLVPRGKFASQIFGYEIQATELYFDGYINKLPEDELNALICGIVFENKTKAPYSIANRDLKHVLREFRVKIEKLASIELEYCKYPSIKLLENAMAETAYRWSAGATFAEITSSQSLLLEGDLIRLFRNCVDLLRQFKRSLVQDPSAYAKVESCLKKMNRDVVDAEQYFN